MMGRQGADAEGGVSTMVVASLSPGEGGALRLFSPRRRPCWLRDNRSASWSASTNRASGAKHPPTSYLATLHRGGGDRHVGWDRIRQYRIRSALIGVIARSADRGGRGRADHLVWLTRLVVRHPRMVCKARDRRLTETGDVGGDYAGSVDLKGRLISSRRSMGSPTCRKTPSRQISNGSGFLPSRC